MLKYILFSGVFIPVNSFAQDISDTLHVATDKMGTSVTKYYVVGGCREMVVHQSQEKCDTTFYDCISDFTREAYNRELRLIKLRQKPISKVDADEVFDYFSIGDSIVNVTKRLGNKKIHVIPRGYEVAFYNKGRRKNEIFEFCFFDGKLSSIGRASINALPTNDVWTAFFLMSFKEEIHNLDLLIKKLRMNRAGQNKRY